MNFLVYIVSLIAAYIVGAFPTGYYLAQLCGVNITHHGSGNIGATNVGRVLGKKYFFLVLFFDVAKAYACLSMITKYTADNTLLVLSGLMLVIGNSFSIFLRGQGGKTVAVSIGVLLALAPVLFLYVATVWTVVFMLTRTVGISSVAAFVIAPCVGYHFAYIWPVFYVLLVCMSVWGVVRHRKNIHAWIYK